MSETNIILLALTSLALQVTLIYLFVKHLNLTKEISKSNITLHEDLLQIRLNSSKLGSKEILKDFENKSKEKVSLNTNTVTDLKSTPVSKEELEKLMKGKELAFKKEISVKAGEMFINTDIEI